MVIAMERGATLAMSATRFVGIAFLEGLRWLRRGSVRTASVPRKKSGSAGLKLGVLLPGTGILREASALLLTGEVNVKSDAFLEMEKLCVRADALQGIRRVLEIDSHRSVVAAATDCAS